MKLQINSTANLRGSVKPPWLAGLAQAANAEIFVFYGISFLWPDLPPILVEHLAPQPSSASAA